ncbi:MAG: PEGA domain-containing protein [bacterium]
MQRPNTPVFIALLLIVTAALTPSTTFADSNLTLKSSPSNATVSLGQNQLGTTPLSVTLEPGPSNLSLSLGDLSVSSSLKLQGDLTLTVNLDSTQQDPPYRVLLLSKPRNATVKVDGKDRGRAPWTGRLKPGKHTFEVYKKGYRLWTAEINVRSALSLRAVLKSPDRKDDLVSPEETNEDQPRTDRRVNRVSAASGQSVKPLEDDVRLVLPVEEQHQHSLEQLVKKSSGRKTVKTTQQDTPAATKQTDTEPVQKSTMTEEDLDTAAQKSDTLGQVNEFEKTKEPPPNFLFKVLSQPDSSVVFINGERHGVTPYTLEDVSPGTYTIKLTRDGYGDWKETFYLNEPTRLNIQLKPERAYLHVRPEPAGMKLNVGQSEFNLNGPQNFQVQPGKYKVSATAPGYESYDTTLALKGGSTSKLRINLKREPKLWEYPSTRDVFLRMARSHLKDLVADLGVGSSSRLAVIPLHQDWAHQLIGEVFTVVLNENGVAVVDEPQSRKGKKKLDRELKFYLVEMDVNYEPAGRESGVKWIKRHFDLKLHAKLIDHENGEVHASQFFHRSSRDKIPAKFKSKLSKPYQPPETEPPIK